MIFLSRTAIADGVRRAMCLAAPNHEGFASEALFECIGDSQRRTPPEHLFIH